MLIGKQLLNELNLEAAVTRRYLENVPFNQLHFKPHEKSETLGRLAVHLAEIVAWWSSVIETKQLDFENFEPKVFQRKVDLLNYYDELLEKAKKSLSDAKDEEFEKKWSMIHGNEILFTLPKIQVARLFCMNHFIHHRAQLGVYLRLLNIEVPASYGPSSDDENVILINPFR